MKEKVTKQFAVCFDAFPIQFYWATVEITYIKSSKMSLISNIYKTIKKLYPNWKSHYLLQISDIEEDYDTAYYCVHDGVWLRNDF